MGFQIFPERTPEERRAERREAMQAVKWFGLVALTGFGLIIITALIQPAWDSWWTTVGLIGVVGLLLGLYLGLQSLFEFTIVATIGMERAFAIGLAILLIAGPLWWFGLLD